MCERTQTQTCIFTFFDRDIFVKNSSNQTAKKNLGRCPVISGSCYCAKTCCLNATIGFERFFFFNYFFNLIILMSNMNSIDTKL